MLKVTIHAGPLKSSSIYTRIAWLDIAYEQLKRVADYKTVLFVNGIGARNQQLLLQYPRWSGSLWDLVLRSILVNHNQKTDAEHFPEETFSTKNFAFAERVSAEITHYPGSGRKTIRRIGQCEIIMEKKGKYVAIFEEHAGPRHESAEFVYNPKYLDPSLLLAHGICAAFSGDPETIPSRPIFKEPPVFVPTGETKDFFNISTVHEPLRTGLALWLSVNGKSAHPSSTVGAEIFELSYLHHFADNFV